MLSINSVFISSDRACCFKVIGSLKKKFKSPFTAEKYLQKSAEKVPGANPQHTQSTSAIQSAGTQSEVVTVSVATQTDNIEVATQTSCDKETVTVGAQPQSDDTSCTSPSGVPQWSQVFLH